MHAGPVAVGPSRPFTTLRAMPVSSPASIARAEEHPGPGAAVRADRLMAAAAPLIDFSRASDKVYLLLRELRRA